MSLFSSHREIPETVVMSVDRQSRVFSIGLCTPFLFLIFVGIVDIWDKYEQTHVLNTQENQNLIVIMVVMLMLVVFIFHKLKQAKQITLTVHRPSRMFIYKDGDYEVRFFATGVGKVLYEGSKTQHLYIHLKSGEELFIPWQLNANTRPSMSAADFLFTYSPSLGIPTPRSKILHKITK